MKLTETLQTLLSLCLAASSLGAPNLLEGGEHHHHGDHHHGDHHHGDQPHEHHPHSQTHEHHEHEHEASHSSAVYFIPDESAPLVPVAKADTEEKPEYSFEYAVKHESTDLSAQEHRDGDKTEGFYQVLLPDSRLQKVTYSVNGDSGFVAEVSYEGEAKQPEDQLHTAAAVDLRSVYPAHHSR
ncbi:knob-associated histidine-rich protein-like [Penaeus japonicus]|uniref:knob-associated histidine-rich protein-like n=1 Tax=Penaeus japonicus TaxID=27405 RepID=UPI001C70D37F|nr:knob-associated histidine-rich protein-like [Penaeus japonicus]